MRDAVRMIRVSKSFGGVRALDNVDFALRWGEIHALLGENGAGKSTLLKILRGVHSLDSGSIDFDEESPARLAGHRGGGRVAMIFQEMSLVPSLTVAQNIFLNRESRGAFGLIDDKAAVGAAGRLFEEFGVDIDPGERTSSLSAGQRQLTEIVKAISQQARILVLDEPTSALADAEVAHLFGLLNRLRGDGAAIIYVSHRMEEIMRIADRATIMRDGRHVTTAPIAELTLDAIIEHIVGRRVGNFSGAGTARARPGETLLELRGIFGKAKLRNVDLALRSGEIVGVAGLLGSGRSALARAIFGLEPVKSGTIEVHGTPRRIASPIYAIAAGIALVPEDRLRQGSIAQHSVADNIQLPILDRLTRYIWLAVRDGRRIVADQMRRLKIKADSPDAAVGTLSGGNQQKVVLAKWLAADPDVLILDEPTAGIDIGSKLEIVALIREMAIEGKAIMLLSSEISELLAASDRIIVMAHGAIVRDFAREDLDPPVGAGGDASERLRYAERQLQAAIQGGTNNG